MLFSTIITWWPDWGSSILSPNEMMWDFYLCSLCSKAFWLFSSCYFFLTCNIELIYVPTGKRQKETVSSLTLPFLFLHYPNHQLLKLVSPFGILVTSILGMWVHSSLLAVSYKSWDLGLLICPFTFGPISKSFSLSIIFHGFLVKMGNIRIYFQSFVYLVEN